MDIWDAWEAVYLTRLFHVEICHSWLRKCSLSVYVQASVREGYLLYWGALGIMKSSKLQVPICCSLGFLFPYLVESANIEGRQMSWAVNCSFSSKLRPSLPLMLPPDKSTDPQFSWHLVSSLCRKSVELTVIYSKSVPGIWASHTLQPVIEQKGHAKSVGIQSLDKYLRMMPETVTILTLTVSWGTPQELE